MTKSILALVLIIKGTCVLSQVLNLTSFKLSEDGRLKFPELAVKYGHPAEEHYVITDDGYILTLFHLPGDRRRAVLLVHGNTPAVDCWIIRGNSSLAITLAKQGYDVWAISLRGTRYSRRHIFVDPDSEPEKFFDYTFYEAGIYDLPATIDYVLEKTGQRQVLAIGHSVGTTGFYIMGSERPEYNNKIKLAISLAPICFVQSNRGLSATPPVLELLIALWKHLKHHEVLSQEEFGPVARLFCFQPLGYELCVKGFLYSLLGRNVASIEPEFMFTLFGHWPGGSTRKMIEHLKQIIDQDRFARYDYGKRRNLLVYGTLRPPEFDLGRVTMKSALLVGREDYLSGVRDVERLNQSLPNVVHYQIMPYRSFSHADFIWGRDMPKILYPYLLNIIEKYI